MQSLKARLKEKGHRPLKKDVAKTKNFSFNPGPIYYLLNNRLYIGEVKHKDKFYDGNHEAIISKSLWNEVQAKLTKGRVNRKCQVNSRYPSLLIGLLFDRNGNRYTPSHSNKRGTRYRYYNLPSAKNGYPLGRLPALEIESAVKEQLIQYIEEESRQLSSNAEGHTRAITDHNTFEQIEQLMYIIHIFKYGTPHEQRALATKLIKKVQLYQGGMDLWVNKKAWSYRKNSTGSALHRIETKVDIKRQVSGAKILVSAGKQQVQKPDQKLIRLIARAQLWAKDLESGNFTTMSELGNHNCVDKGELGKTVRLAYLAPDIINSILEGRQPPALKVNTLRRMSDLPTDWDAQRKKLGFI